MYVLRAYVSINHFRKLFIENCKNGQTFVIAFSISHKFFPKIDY